MPKKKIKRGKLESIRKLYEKEYYVKSKWSEDEIDLHHIRPVKYGGNSKLNNDMAIPREDHKWITKWFVNY